MKGQRGSIALFVLITIVSLVIIVPIYLFISSHPLQFGPPMPCPAYGCNGPLPIGGPISTPYPSPSSGKGDTILLKHKTAAGTEIVFNFSAYDSSSRIARWGDYLFWGSAAYGTEVDVTRYNLKTSETKKIYREETSRKDISDLQLIDNTLFFSVGGYLAPGASYWYDPKTDSTPQKITDISNGRIEFINNRYFLVGGEGDGCGGNTTYFTLDIKTKAAVHIADTQEGCAEGEGFVGIDSQNRIILASHKLAGDNFPPMSFLYDYVVAIPADSPSQKTILLNKQQLPENTNSVEYNQVNDWLIISNDKKKYYFDLKQNSLKELAPDQVLPLPSPYETPDPTGQSTPGKVYKKLIESLNLPPDYILSLE